jgi:hypothetical protein
MSFKSWALANPTRTAGYLRVKEEIRNCETSIQSRQQEIAHLEAGGLPDWFRHEDEETRPSFLFNSIVPRLEFSYFGEWLKRRWGIPDELIQEIKRLRWEREAIDAEDRRNDMEKNARKFELERLRDYLTGKQEELAVYKQQLNNYAVPNDMLNWHLALNGFALHENREWSMKVCEHLNWRFGYLVGDIDLFQDYFDSTLEVIQNAVARFDACFQTYLHFDFRVNSTWWSTWRVSVGDGVHTFTRTDNDERLACAYALLDYTEHRWDELITKCD